MKPTARVVTGSKKVAPGPSLTKLDAPKPSTATSRPVLPPSKSATYSAPRSGSGARPTAGTVGPSAVVRAPLAKPKLAFDDASSTKVTESTTPTDPVPAPQIPRIDSEAPSVLAQPPATITPIVSPSVPAVVAATASPRKVVPPASSTAAARATAPTAPSTANVMTPSPPRVPKPDPDHMVDPPWPELTPSDNAFLDGAKLEERGGEYLYHTPDHGYYACRRCRATIARYDSRIRAEGGFAAFAKYCATNLTVGLDIGRRDTQFTVRCSKCRAFIGVLTSDLTAGAHLRANSRALWYTHRQPPPTSILPADAAFNQIGAVGDADDDLDDPGLDNFDELTCRS